MVAKEHREAISDQDEFEISLAFKAQPLGLAFGKGCCTSHAGQPPKRHPGQAKDPGLSQQRSIQAMSAITFSSSAWTTLYCISPARSFRAASRTNCHNGRCGMHPAPGSPPMRTTDFWHNLLGERTNGRRKAPTWNCETTRNSFSKDIQQIEQPNPPVLLQYYDFVSNSKMFLWEGANAMLWNKTQRID
jgi:hypothetical protein